MSTLLFFFLFFSLRSCSSPSHPPPLSSSLAGFLELSFFSTPCGSSGTGSRKKAFPHLGRGFSSVFSHDGRNSGSILRDPPLLGPAAAGSWEGFLSRGFLWSRGTLRGPGVNRGSAAVPSSASQVLVLCGEDVPCSWPLEAELYPPCGSMREDG